MVNLLAAAALAAAMPATMRLPHAADEPAMFVVRDADTTVYIFGTFHALDGDAHWFDAQRSRRLRAVERAGARDLASGRARHAVIGRSAQPVRAAVGHALGLVPRDNQDGDQRRPGAGHAGRQWRRHGPSPRRRSRRQARRGPRDAPAAAQHVQLDAAPRPPRRRARRPAQPDRRAADAEPVEGDGRDAVRVEARRPERLRPDARPVRSGPRPTPTG